MNLLSPARLGHARNFACMDHLAETYPTKPKLAVHRSRSTATATAGVGANLKLGGSLLLIAKSLFGD